jgi:predicted house-cleaning noncanonical NTP pyrophosphatase (MazG superfamily)
MAKRTAPTLSQIVDSIQKVIVEAEKTAATVENTELNTLLNKVAEELKTYNSEVTYDDLTDYVKTNG